MPAIWDPAFRRPFYERWGRESAVISARCRRVEYPEYTQLLSIKTVSGGTEDYFVDGRRIAVEDDTYLVLNSGRTYGSRIDSLRRPVHSFSIFFEDGMAEDVRRNLEQPMELLLEMPEGQAPRMEFDEHVREHDSLVTPVLRHIRSAVQSGLASEAWLDEQLRFLLLRMVRGECRRQRRQELIPGRRPAIRRELRRRIGLALTFIHTHYRERIGLTQIARAARLSPFHFLRIFRAYQGMTPSAYLSEKRVGTALRLIATTQNTGDIAARLVPRSRRSRDIFAVMDEVRGAVNGAVPRLHIEFV